MEGTGNSACKAATLIGEKGPLGETLRASGLTMAGKIQNLSLGDGVDEGRDVVRGARGVNMHGGLQGRCAEANGINMDKLGRRLEACPQSFIPDYGRRFQTQAGIWLVSTVDGGRCPRGGSASSHAAAGPVRPRRW